MNAERDGWIDRAVDRVVRAGGELAGLVPDVVGERFLGKLESLAQLGGKLDPVDVADLVIRAVDRPEHLRRIGSATFASNSYTVALNPDDFEALRDVLDDVLVEDCRRMVEQQIRGAGFRTAGEVVVFLAPSPPVTRGNVHVVAEISADAPRPAALTRAEPDRVGIAPRPEDPKPDRPPPVDPPPPANREHPPVRSPATRLALDLAEELRCGEWLVPASLPELLRQLAEGERDGAVDALRRLVDRHPRDRIVTLVRAITSLGGELESAPTPEEVEDAAAGPPRIGSGYAAAALMWERDGEVARAAVAYDAALEIERRDWVEKRLGRLRAREATQAGVDRAAAARRRILARRTRRTARWAQVSPRPRPGSALPAVRLVLREPDTVREMVLVNGTHLLAGRAPHCDLLLDGRGVLGTHALVRLIEDGVQLTDLNTGGRSSLRDSAGEEVAPAPEVTVSGAATARLGEVSCRMDPLDRPTVGRALVVHASGEPSRCCVLSPTGVSFGRASEGGDPVATVELSDGATSALHAHLRWTPEGLELEDAGSSNGTLLNGRRIEGRERLAPGDLLVMGRTEIEVDTADALPFYIGTPSPSATPRRRARATTVIG